MKERKDNYAIQAQNAIRLLLSYDLDAIVRKLRLSADRQYLYPVVLGQTYRLDRTAGTLERMKDGAWISGGWNAMMTLADLLGYSREDRQLSGRFKSMQDFGLMFHTGLLEKERDPAAERFDRDPALFQRGCMALGGEPFPGGDMAYRMEVFDGLPIAVQFWHGDDEFAPRLRWLWDANALQYLHYETMYYAVNLLLELLEEKGAK